MPLKPLSCLNRNLTPLLYGSRRLIVKLGSNQVRPRLTARCWWQLMACRGLCCLNDMDSTRESSWSRTTSHPVVLHSSCWCLANMAKSPCQNDDYHHALIAWLWWNGVNWRYVCFLHHRDEFGDELFGTWPGRTPQQLSNIPPYPNNWQSTVRY